MMFSQDFDWDHRTRAKRSGNGALFNFGSSLRKQVPIPPMLMWGRLDPSRSDKKSLWLWPRFRGGDGEI